MLAWVSVCVFVLICVNLFFFLLLQHSHDQENIAVLNSGTRYSIITSPDHRRSMLVKCHSTWIFQMHNLRLINIVADVACNAPVHFAVFHSSFRPFPSTVLHVLYFWACKLFIEFKLIDWKICLMYFILCDFFCHSLHRREKKNIVNSKQQQLAFEHTLFNGHWHSDWSLAQSIWMDYRVKCIYIYHRQFDAYKWEMNVRHRWTLIPRTNHWIRLS